MSVEQYVMLGAAVCIAFVAGAAFAAHPRRRDRIAQRPDRYGWICREVGCDAEGECASMIEADRAFRRHWHREHWRPYLTPPA